MCDEFSREKKMLHDLGMEMSDCFWPLLKVHRESLLTLSEAEFEQRGIAIEQHIKEEMELSMQQEIAVDMIAERRERMRDEQDYLNEVIEALVEAKIDEYWTDVGPSSAIH